MAATDQPTFLSDRFSSDGQFPFSHTGLLKRKLLEMGEVASGLRLGHVDENNAWKRVAHSAQPWFRHKCSRFRSPLKREALRLMSKRMRLKLRWGHSKLVRVRDSILFEFAYPGSTIQADLLTRLDQAPHQAQ